MYIRVMLLGFLAATSQGQWLNYPTPGVPRNSDGKVNLAARAPRAADGKPDLSGMWEMHHNRNATTNGVGCEPPSPEFLNIAASLKEGLPYHPWAVELVRTRRADSNGVRPITRGLPAGIVSMHTIPLLRKVVQSPGLVFILNEYNASYRQIFTDGRPLPLDPNPSWSGYSSGRWDGDTLVVQTTGFRDGLWLDVSGNPLTEMAKITERFRRVNYGTLEIELTVDDPKAYTKPWTVTLTQVIVVDTELLESYIDNEKDIQHMVVK